MQHAPCACLCVFAVHVGCFVEIFASRPAVAAGRRRRRHCRLPARRCVASGGITSAATATATATATPAIAAVAARATSVPTAERATRPTASSSSLYLAASAASGCALTCGRAPVSTCIRTTVAQYTLRHTLLYPGHPVVRVPECALRLSTAGARCLSAALDPLHASTFDSCSAPARPRDNIHAASWLDRHRAR